MKNLLYHGLVLVGCCFCCFCSDVRSDMPIVSSPTTESSTTHLPRLNQCVLDTILRYGKQISPTYEQAVCTEFVVKILEHFYPLNKIDKARINIITSKPIPDLLQQNSPIPTGVVYALSQKGIGTPIKQLDKVKAGDFLQFWQSNLGSWTWGHCGIVKSIDLLNNTMQIYSSDPSTNGYGIKEFGIPQHIYFVRLQ